MLRFPDIPAPPSWIAASGGMTAVEDGIACPCCQARPPVAGGHGLNKPLDSGLRRAAMGILPSRRIQDFLSINDGGLKSGIRQEEQRGYRDGDKPIPTPVVIPAKAGIQAGRLRSEGMAGFI